MPTEESEVLKKVDAIDRKVGRLEDKVTLLDKTQAVQAERSQHIDQALKAIQGSLNRLGWLVGAAIVSAVVKFILDGGLSNV